MDGEQSRRIPLQDNGLGQGLILVAAALMCLGVVMSFSTAGARRSPSAWYYRLDIRQAAFAAVGLLLLCALWRRDYRWLVRRWCPERRILGWVLSPSGLLFLLAVGLAAGVLVLGRTVKGSARWLRYGPIGFQPSELLKFALLIYLAAFLTWVRDRAGSFWRAFVPAGALTAVACGLIVTQDFGTAAIVGVGALAVMLMAGMRWWHFLVVPPAVAVGFYAFVYRVPYRWDRIAALTQPFSSTAPAAYQPRQSVIAIGSGIDPAGIGGGAAKYGYLPEAQPDFIFSVICQELGLLGASLVIALLLGWLLLAWRVAVRAPDRFGALLAGGLGALVGLQAILHIAVTVWWMPPTGVSLCFVSAGGSGLLTLAAATALIVSVSARRGAGPEPERLD